VPHRVLAKRPPSICWPLAGPWSQRHGELIRSPDWPRLVAKHFALDVADEASRVAAVEALLARHGRIDALINNAGYSLSGALELLPMEAVRQQFETNVFGLLRLCQLVLPTMRAQGSGRIVNVSSMGGKLTFPGGGAYHATKHAVEALSDALRFEVAGFGVRVIVIEPGLIRTGFADAAQKTMTPQASAVGPYAEFDAAVARTTKESYEKGPLASLGGPPQRVASVIVKALEVKAPKGSLSRHRLRHRLDDSAKPAERLPVGWTPGAQLPPPAPRQSLTTNLLLTPEGTHEHVRRDRSRP